MLFENLNIVEPILKALKSEGYSNPTPIQEQSIPTLLKGQDLLGCAQTGTGKTASFAIPILQQLYNEQETQKGPRTIKALILAPTRELAIQIGESFTSYGKYLNLKNTVIFGGVSQKSQTDALRAGIDILIATPGRLLDLMQQKYIRLDNIKHFVLDEADRMLDMGLGHDVKRVIAQLPKARQTMLFSATMPPEISKLVDSILVNPAKVAVTPVSSTIDTIKQGIYFVDKKDKKHLLIYLLKNKSLESVLVFSRTKHGANKITQELAKVGIESQAIHGNKSQTARQLALSNFKTKKIRVLVATDIAARGIDVDELSHVINFDLPEVPETYVHRIGRTGRAGAQGVALSFCDEEEKPLLKDIQKLISKVIPVIEENPYSTSDLGTVENNEPKKFYSDKTKQNNFSKRPTNRRFSGKQQPKKQ
jgi:ATP-dependent RNA helicase RhlE